MAPALIVWGYVGAGVHQISLVAVATIAPVAASTSRAADPTESVDRVDADDGAILGVARYERVGPERAEVAFAVEGHWRGHGIATALLHRRATYARARGITQFPAIAVATNNRMLEVLQHAAYPLTVQVCDGEVEATLDISRPAANGQRPAAREP